MKDAQRNCYVASCQLKYWQFWPVMRCARGEPRLLPSVCNNMCHSFVTAAWISPAIRLVHINLRVTHEVVANYQLASTIGNPSA